MEIKVPQLPESVTDAVILQWNIKPGDFVNKDDILLELETDKIVLEVPAPKNGIITKLLINEQDTVTANTVLATLEESEKQQSSNEDIKDDKKPEPTIEEKEDSSRESSQILTSPSIRRAIKEKDLKITQGSGKHGKILLNDLDNYNKNSADLDIPISLPKDTNIDSPNNLINKDNEKEDEFLVTKTPITRIRKRIAARLLQAKNETAMLTTFNKVALDEIKKIRASHQEDFVKKYGVKLGFMSFFTKAACIALNEFPLVNARLEHESIVEHHYCSVGIAVSTERGLVVPVIKNAHKLSLAEIEMQIKDFATKARSNQLNIDDMQGGTFTITNGGVFGSMLSTPILNAPQTAILGMHNIEPTPVVVNDEIVIRQIMYLALSYDHRLVDGKDSVQFLVRIKQLLEDPTKLLIGV